VRDGSTPTASAVRPRVWVVVPAFNEGSVIGDVVRSLVDRGHRVIVVDDGSPDNTARVATEAGAIVIRHAINRGAGAATQTGITHALRCGADVVVTFDADGQHHPDDIPALVSPIVAGTFDVVFGSRFLDSRSKIPVGRRVLLRLGTLFTRVISRVRVTDPHIGLRAFSRSVASQLSVTMDRFAHASELIDQIHSHRWRFGEVPVLVSYSDYSVAKGQRPSNAVRIALQMLLERLR
jgi:polyprenyl-phospho-N-acetylgalactosaminyl synthase